jgi:hypothetical protein
MDFAELAVHPKPRLGCLDPLKKKIKSLQNSLSIESYGTSLEHYI